jgi:DNA polymerase I-like protein with 3'-5' exonuclease and polymerase domains
MLTISNPRTFDWAGMSLSDCCEGNAADTYFTLKLFHLIEEKIKELGMEKIVSKLIMPSLSTFTEMEYEGMDVSESKLKDVGRQLTHANIEEEDELYKFKEVKTSDNLSSNSDLIEILYTRDDGFQMYPPDRTAKGAPSVSAPTLKLLLSQIEKELEDRE